MRSKKNERTVVVSAGTDIADIGLCYRDRPTVESKPAPIESSTAETVDESNTQEANEVSQPRQESQRKLTKIIRWGVVGYLGVGVLFFLFFEGIWN